MTAQLKPHFPHFDENVLAPNVGKCLKGNLKV